MKKLKFLPSALMLIMCVGVLAVGVFAISPIISTIGGTLSISAAQGVKVAVYNNEGMSANSLVDSAFGGANTEVDLGEISLDSSNASTASDVTPKVFYIKLTTNQDKNYVVDTETIEYIDGIGVTSGEIIKNAGLVTKMHTYTATDGKGRACFNKTNPYTIKLSIKCGALSTEVVNMAFDLALNIYEENDANFTDAEINGVDYLYFGSYPQSLASETLTSYAPNGETYGAYDDNGGEMQRPVYIKNGDTSGNKFVEMGSKLYKIEPIKWNILAQTTSGSLTNTTGNTMLVSDLVLEHVYYRKNYEYTDVKFNGEYVQDYWATQSDGTTLLRDANGNSVYANNYKYSDLRAFITGTFYQNAFSNFQEGIIKYTSVKNDASTAHGSTKSAYICEDTDDKVFALSYQDVLNVNYGYVKHENESEQRKKISSPYCQATNGGMSCNSWWLRTPYTSGYRACDVQNSGALYDIGTVNEGSTGVAPAIHIDL